MNGLDINGAKMAGKDITKIVGVPIIIGQPKENEPGDIPTDYDTIAQIDAPGESAEAKPDSHITEMSDLVKGSASILIARGQRPKGSLEGFSCGFKQIDKALDGLQRGNMYGCGGRPGMGKSIVALQMSLNVASTGVGVYYISLEMPSLEHGRRVLFNRSGVQSWRWKEGEMRPDDWRAVTACVPDAAKLPIIWDDSTSQTIEQIHSKIKMVKGMFTAKGGELGLVVIDHTLLVQGSVSGDRRSKFAHVTKEIKNIAKDEMVAILALSQLNRQLEARTVKDKRPQMSDFKETGTWEEDADAMMLLYREDYYEKDPKKWNHELEINIPKIRGGQKAWTKLYFDGDCQRVLPMTGEGTATTTAPDPPRESVEPVRDWNEPPAYEGDPDA